MDLTSQFRKLTRQQSINSSSTKPGKDSKTVFLSEACIIAKHLNSLRGRIVGLRPAYLNLQTAKSNRHHATRLTDPERDQIDRSIKDTIRQMLDKVQSLNQIGEAALELLEDKDSHLETARVLFGRLVDALDPRHANNNDGGEAETVKGGMFGLTKLGKRDTLAAHQSSIIWWLNSRLRTTNKVHADMQELYLNQKLERQRNYVNSSKKNQTYTNNNHHDELLNHLSEQELQQLQLENESMVGEFESALNQIQDTQRSIVEISTLQSQLATEIDQQMQQTERLYNEAVGAVDAVDQGNEFLISARKNQATARRWVMVILVVLSLVLLFLDWFG